MGWAMAPSAHWDRLGFAVLAFFLALGICAHALDELRGRPLKSEIPSKVLIFLSAASLGGAVAVGVLGAVETTPWLLVSVGAGAFFVLSYNLELAGGRFHSIFWFSLAWGSFPVLTGYFANQESLGLVAVATAGAAFYISVVQRTLSAPVRYLRRRVAAVKGVLEESQGGQLPLSKAQVLKPAEQALMALNLAVVMLSGALLLAKV